MLSDPSDQLYCSFYTFQPFADSTNEYPKGMMGMLIKLNIPHVGRHHSGIGKLNIPHVGRYHSGIGKLNIPHVGRHHSGIGKLNIPHVGRHHSGIQVS